MSDLPAAPAGTNGSSPTPPAATPAGTPATNRLNIVVVGHVDHGKSTLIGRLLFDTDSLKLGKVEAVRRACEAEGMDFEYAFLLDALLEEQEQNITIDTTRIPFRTATREYAIIDAPGHTEFLKNMVTGAASASAAFLLIDAREGIREQSRRHAHLLHLLGISQLVVLLNKMDLVGFDEARYRSLVADYAAFLSTLGLTAAHFIPIAARHGDNIASRSQVSPWWKGPTVVEALDGFTDTNTLDSRPLRFVVQDVYRWDDRRILAGRVEAGRLAVGDRVLFAPGGRSSTVRSIERWSSPPRDSAECGESIGISLADELFVERGAIAGHLDAPPAEQQQFRARVFWLSETALAPGQAIVLRLGTQESVAEVSTIHAVVDATSLEARRTGPAVSVIRRHEIAEVSLRTRRPVAFDPAADVPPTGRFALFLGRQAAGGGIILPGDYFRRLPGRQATENVFWTDAKVTPALRAARNGHAGLVVWLTGLSGSGKSTIATELERQLFLSGRQVYLLDGDNLRHGLCAGLGFSREDRAENIRRAGAAAALLADAGMIVICSLISPFASDRARARAMAPAGRFIEVFVNAPLAVCRQRDPKGLYARAERGEIREFTGITSPYEAPESPELELRTDELSPAAAVDKLLHAITPRLDVATGPEI